jgi:hypothetical protein
LLLTNNVAGAHVASGGPSSSGFLSARSLSIDACTTGQPGDFESMMMIELLRRRGWSIPRACAAIAKVRAIDKSAKTLQDRYKVL